MKVVLISPFSPFRQHDHAASDLLVKLVEQLAPRLDLYVYSPDADMAQESARAAAAGCELLDCRARAPSGVRARIGPKPYWQRSVWNRQMSTEVRAHIDRINPGIVHGEYLQSGEALDGLPRTVLMLHDVTTDVMRRALSSSGKLQWPYRYAEYVRTRNFETHAIESATVPLAISEPDLQRIRAINPAARYVPPGIDRASVEWRVPSLSQPPEFLFMGAMWREANAHAALFLGRQVMPLVWRANPDARLRIVGARPRALVAQLADDPRIEVVGHVQSFEPEMLRASAVFAPTIYGGGVLMKVLKPMALGCPVITNPEVLAAIGAGEDSGISCSTPQEFASAAVSVIENPQLAARIGIGARRLVESRFSWDASIEALLSAYELAVTG
jgi:hypothetical protein